MNRIAAAAVTALVLATSLAAPAQAQAFGIFFGDERSDFVPEFAICLNDNQIRNSIADLGYTDISLNVPNDKHIQVRATQGGDVYLLDFNYCTGRIEEARYLRPAG